MYNILVISEYESADYFKKNLKFICYIGEYFHDSYVSGIVFGINKDTDWTGENIGINELYLSEAELALSQKYDIISEIVRKSQINLVIGMDCEWSRRFLPGLAAMLNADLLMNGVGLESINEDLFVRKEHYYGNILSRYSVDLSKITLLNITQFPNETGLETNGNNKRKAVVHKLNVGSNPSKEYVQLISKIPIVKKEEDIGKSDIVVCIGRAFSTEAQVNEAKKYAHKIGAALAASRPLVDEGLVELKCQVGQTGRTIRPQIYIALGISGAPQHICGMLKSKLVIAVNRDENAEIFKYSDYGYVGDVFEVLNYLNK